MLNNMVELEVKPVKRIFYYLKCYRALNVPIPVLPSFTTRGRLSVSGQTPPCRRTAVTFQRLIQLASATAGRRCCALVLRTHIDRDYEQPAHGNSISALVCGTITRSPCWTTTRIYGKPVFSDISSGSFQAIERKAEGAFYEIH